MCNSTIKSEVNDGFFICKGGKCNRIRNNSFFFEGIFLEYGLFECQKTDALGHMSITYFIAIICGDESERVSLGESSHSAQSVYELLMKNGVTPCTLNDIYEDLVN